LGRTALLVAAFAEDWRAGKWGCRDMRLAWCQGDLGKAEKLITETLKGKMLHTTPRFGDIW
jgi:hypothetical protein